MILMKFIDIINMYDKIFDDIYDNNLLEFIFFNLILFTISLITRYILFRRLIESSNNSKRYEGLFKFTSISQDLCLIAICGIFILSKIDTPQLDTNFFVWTISIIFILLLLTALLSGYYTSYPDKRKLFYSSFRVYMGLHIPNLLGSVAVVLTLLIFLSTTK